MTFRSFYNCLIAPMLVLGTYVCAAEVPRPGIDTPTYDGDLGAGEGPAWDDDGSLFFTNERQIIKRDRVGKLHVFREPSNDASGLLFDFERRLVICEGATRRVTRLERSGAITILADSYQGKKLNSPNDLAIDSEGRIYFSDPRYGNRDGMEMSDEHARTIEGVYRIDAPGKVTRVLGPEIQRANGLAISPHGEFLVRCG
jgi:gluconolactonase